MWNESGGALKFDFDTARRGELRERLEPYGGRSPATVRDDLKYLHERYGRHPAVWRQRAPRELEEVDAPEKKYVGTVVPGSTRASGRKLPLVFLLSLIHI